nr:putative reverse transcriptase domain-containing protein [Tanacetum cinerariifolium]
MEYPSQSSVIVTVDSHQISEGHFKRLWVRWTLHSLERVGDVSYKLDLPKECHADEPLAVLLDGLHFDDKLHFVEKPMEIVDREVKWLKRSRIPLVKVRWNSKRGPEFTWEREDQFRKKYPHLFARTASASSVASDDLLDTLSVLYLTSTRLRVHNTFHVSNLKKCHADKPLDVPLDGLHFDDKLHFVEEPVEIVGYCNPCKLVSSNERGGNDMWVWGQGHMGRSREGLGTVQVRWGCTGMAGEGVVVLAGKGVGEYCVSCKGLKGWQVWSL